VGTKVGGGNEMWESDRVRRGGRLAVRRAAARRERQVMGRRVQIDHNIGRARQRAVPGGVLRCLTGERKMSVGSKVPASRERAAW
jgi:hypothetical protein